MIKINDIEYTVSAVTINPVEKIFKITTNNSSPPRSLSKYYSLSERNVLSFINANIYASIPDQFNDIFDTLIQQINLDDITDEDLLRVYEKTNHKPNPHCALEIRLRIKPALKGLWDYSIGILCLSNKQQSDLMWAHYAHNTGFLVEYDTSLFPKHFHQPIEINYLPDNYNLQLKPRDDKELIEQVLVVSSLKKKIWDYEEEYRILVFRSASNCSSDWQIQSIPSESITKLILGPRFFNDLYDICAEDDHIIDFNRDKGTIRKLLIDQAIQIGIPIEHAMIELNSRSILNRKIAFEEEKLKSGIYQLKYLDQK